MTHIKMAMLPGMVLSKVPTYIFLKCGIKLPYISKHISAKWQRDLGHTWGTKLWERKSRCTHGDPSVWYCTHLKQAVVTL